MSLELQSTLSLIIQQLASFFGTTADAVMTNAPEWLTKYGWYCVLNDTPVNIFIGTLIGGLIVACIWGVLAIIIESEEKKDYIVSAAIIIPLCIIIAVGVSIMQCWIAPEIYGLQALIKLVK